MSADAELKPTTPSERIAADLPSVELSCAAHIRTTLQPMSDEMWVGFLGGEEGAPVVAGIETGARILCILRELDREAGRRSAWEAKVEADLLRLAKAGGLT